MSPDLKGGGKAKISGKGKNAVKFCTFYLKKTFFNIVCFLLEIYKVSTSNPPPPKPSGEVEKMAFFSLSLNFFTFTRRSRKIKIFFCKKKCTKHCNFHFLEKLFHFQIFRFLHHISIQENEKKVKKMSKKKSNFLLFFYFLWLFWHLF